MILCLVACKLSIIGRYVAAKRIFFLTSRAYDCIHQTFFHVIVHFLSYEILLPLSYIQFLAQATTKYDHPVVRRKHSLYRVL